MFDESSINLGEVIRRQKKEEEAAQKKALNGHRGLTRGGLKAIIR